MILMIPLTSDMLLKCFLLNKFKFKRFNKFKFYAPHFMNSTKK